MTSSALSRRSFIAGTAIVASVPIAAEAVGDGPIIQLYQEFRRREAAIDNLPRDATQAESDWMRAPLDEAMATTPDGNAEWAAIITMAMWATGADADPGWSEVAEHCRARVV
ncbi:hypothetical protein L1787_12930 [Acuticoccus sp. M5D2P5]|uniref:hypothetical protein n=1 Tax=Acuticoccus kalidii TaxID=2910977 RepID=UPI001F1D9E21|nr:hypothetical protein [Acuticoccus kalidii]MCF3934313.1 hypothetical protein [Acuticoccus kalidii]